MKTFSRALIASFTLLLVTASVASARLTFINIYQREMTGEAWEPGVVKVTLKDKDGVVKGYEEHVVSGGRWDVSFPPGGIVVPGDQVVVRLGAMTWEHRVGPIVVTKLSAAKDLIRGTVPPGKPLAGYVVWRSSLTPTGWIKEDFKYQEIGPADGKFSAVTTAVVDLLRGDLVGVGYLEGDFVVLRKDYVPGLEASLGGHWVNLKGLAGKTYGVSLLNPRGKVKGSVTAYVPRPGEPDGALFRRQDGTPIAITPGDRIAVTGRFGFVATVPPLDVTVGGSTVNGVTVPGAGLAVQATLFDTNGATFKYLYCYPQTDPGTGAFSCSWAGETIKAADKVSVIVQDPLGDRYYWEKQILP
jgi:hypothetical protein